MLRSYEYTDVPYVSANFQDRLLGEKERETARKFVSAHPARRVKECGCPVCKSRENGYCFTKWGVDYLRCNSCKSLFAVCSEETAGLYRRNEELLSLRKSEEYQEAMTTIRQEAWEEFLEWLQVRTFRFMHRNTGLSVIDFGNRLEGFVQSIRASDLCSQYNLRDSILGGEQADIEKADLIFYLDQLQQEAEPERRLRELRQCLKPDGMLVLSTRAGSGFDILTLKEKNDRIYPYEHVLLPSVQGLSKLLADVGYEVLEVTTPGVMDVKYVLECRSGLEPTELFIRSILETGQDSVLQEFQRFLQKSCLSSFVRILAKRR